MRKSTFFLLAGMAILSALSPVPSMAEMLSSATKTSSQPTSTAISKTSQTASARTLTQKRYSASFHGSQSPGKILQKKSVGTLASKQGFSTSRIVATSARYSARKDIKKQHSGMAFSRSRTSNLSIQTKSAVQRIAE